MCARAQWPKQVFIQQTQRYTIWRFTSFFMYALPILYAFAPFHPLPRNAFNSARWMNAIPWCWGIQHASSSKFPPSCGLCEWRKYKKNAKSANENRPKMNGNRGKMQFHCVHFTLCESSFSFPDFFFLLLFVIPLENGTLQKHGTFVHCLRSHTTSKST